MPGGSYAEFLIPGIIVQNIAFGGFVTALGLNEDMHKGLIDRFRSLPMARAAVLAGRTSADIVTNGLSMTILIVTGLIIGFSFQTSALHVIVGLVLALTFGYAFSWVFAFLGLLVKTPEAANSVGFIAVFPLTFISSAFVPGAVAADPAAAVRRRQSVHDRRQRAALAMDRPAFAGPAVAGVRLGRVHPRGVLAAGGAALPADRQPIGPYSGASGMATVS